MRHALALAEKGRGYVEPNPMVGAVVLDSTGHFVGEGWHQKFGGPHAEVFALAEAGERARGGTLVVTLEPCCHHGKTPPCTDAVLRAGIARVVAAMADPFPRVAGGGLAVLRAAGVEVSVGLCERDAVALNAPYLKLLRTGRPWVHAKWAMTLDGKLATRASDSVWISGEESRRRVHELRGRVDAVIVGRRTVAADDPLLTARPPGPRTPARVVVSASGELPERCRLRATARPDGPREVPLTDPETRGPVIVFTANPHRLAGWAADGAEVVGLRDAAMSLDAVLADLGQRRFTNVLIEGGAGLLGSALDARAADEFHVFVAPKVVGGAAAPSPVGGAGVARMADALALDRVTFEPSGADVYVHGFAPSRG
ncbi:MAG: bifunctional diaminohydroxyphosphoribosylaminopyrimidine deaminase/5-amino-6-(5-phosphoribosylamino)uracil reductase RibD [Planctomycetes bacterium]|nr:bifunctional diaminohydroxyphosphoribosylaminopyrimidine deaminase/5-amino-6-(5-phosphoribosylamino)uracil reductase RibD [Planctomycetota bacterium]